MKNKFAAGFAVFSLVAIPAVSMAAPVDEPSTVNPGLIQQRYTEQKPKLQITDQVLVQDQQSQADLAKAAQIKFVLNSVSIEGNTVFKQSELEETYKDKLGKEISLADMYAVRDSITKYYRERGYILSRAIIPPQHLGKKGADFKIRIVEGYINSVSVQGEFHGNKDILDNYVSKLRKSGPINSNDLERYLLLINDLAGTSATATLKPAPGKDNAGATDLIINTSHKYVSGLVSIDNSGSKYLGRDLISGEVDENSALGLSEKIAVRGIVSANTNELKFGDISYQMPIGYEGTKIKVLAGRTDTHPGDQLKSLDLDGRTETLDFTVTQPFLRSRKENFTGRAEFAIKDTHSDSFGTQLYDDKTRVLTLGGTYDLADRFGGVNLLDLSGNQSFDVFGASGRQDPKSRTNGETVFTSFDFQASRQQHLFDKLGVLFALSSQYSLDPLLTSEQFGVGGSDFGRGYDFSEITGDSGFAGKIELQYGIDLDNKYLNSLQLYTFYDGGATYNRDRLVGQVDRQSLTSTGVGTRFNLVNSASGYIELAKPLTRNVASEGDKDIRFDFGLSYLF